MKQDRQKLFSETYQKMVKDLTADVVKNLTDDGLYNVYIEYTGDDDDYMPVMFAGYVRARLEMNRIINEANLRELIQLLESQRDIVLKDFDFKRVHRAMVALDWKWYNDEHTDVPVVQELEKHAKRMIDCLIGQYIDSINNNNYNELFTSAGGFQATLYRNTDNGKPYIELSFVLESIDSYDYDFESY